MNMKIALLALLIATIIISAASAIAGISPYSLPQEEEAAKKAMKFVLNSPTYRFDGSKIKLESVMETQTKGCYKALVDFVSSKSGYGDRTDEMLLQVITNHRAEVTVCNGEIVSAVLDGEWDMIKQEIYGGKTTALVEVSSEVK